MALHQTRTAALTKVQSMALKLMSTREAKPEPAIDLNNGVFVYGSLLSPSVLAGALSLSSASPELPTYEPAVLHDFARHKVRGASFPAIVHHKGASVTGALITLRTEEDIKALDLLEGFLYTRQEVEVVVSLVGDVRKAYTYVWDMGLDELILEEWNVPELNARR